MSIRTFFHASSYAVVGASARPDSLGYAISAQMVQSFTTGPVYLVNPRGGTLFDRPVYKSFQDIPGPVEAACICVPAQGVPDVFRECIRNGVRALVIVSGGFAELGPEGRVMEAEMKRLAQEAHARVVGPNCMGLWCPGTGVDMVFLPGDLMARGTGPGPIGLFSQSGALAAGFVNELFRLRPQPPSGGWFSHLISFGNALDVDETDWLDFLREDAPTTQVWSYLEGIHRGPAFLQSLRQTANKKPVLAIKGGASQPGANASSSHSASLRTDDRVFDSLFRLCGGNRVDDWMDLVQAGLAFHDMPLPRGPRVLVITNAGGVGVLYSDMIAREGLHMASLSTPTLDRLRAAYPPFFVVSGNPLDLTASCTVEHLVPAIRAGLEDDNVDAILWFCITVCPWFRDIQHTTNTLIREFGGGQERPTLAKPVIGFTMGSLGDDVYRDLNRAGLPVFRNEKQAVRILRMMWERKSFLLREVEATATATEEDTVGENPEIEKFLTTAQAAGRPMLLETEARQVLAAAGIPTPKGRLVQTADEAVAFFEKEIGSPRAVVLKIVASSIVHKTDEGGVVLGVRSADTLRQRFTELLAKFSSRDPAGILVTEMLEGPSLEMLLGVATDPSFGAVVTAGLGGVAVEALQDVSFGPTPCPPDLARAMLQQLRHQDLLDRGFRGSPPLDRPRFASLITRMAALVDRYGRWIKEVDANPVLCCADGRMAAVDARVVLHPQGTQ